MKYTFLRWWLCWVLILVGTAIVYNLGGFCDIYLKDSSKLSFVIMAIFYVMSIWCGKVSYQVCQPLTKWSDDEANKIVLDKDKVKNLERQEEIGWFASDQCLTLGMIGTVAGFVQMLDGFSQINVGDQSNIKTFLANMSFGMSTALYTTYVGLVCGMFLKLQCLNIGLHLKKINNE